MKITPFIRPVLFGSAVIVLAFSCSKGSTGTNSGGNPPDCTDVTSKSFVADVNPVIQSSCNKSGCHDVASVNGPGPLTNYTQISNAKLAIREAVRTGSMPQGSSLSTSQKNSIICWVDAGAQNN